MTHEFSVFVMVDSSGDHVCAVSRDDLEEQWTDAIGDVPAGTRVLELRLAVGVADTVLSATVPLSPDATMSVV